MHYYARANSVESKNVFRFEVRGGANETLCRDHEMARLASSFARSLARFRSTSENRVASRQLRVYTSGACIRVQIGNLLSGEFALEISGNLSSGSVTGLCEFLKANPVSQVLELSLSIAR